MNNRDRFMIICWISFFISFVSSVFLSSILSLIEASIVVSFVSTLASISLLIFGGYFVIGDSLEGKIDKDTSISEYEAPQFISSLVEGFNNYISNFGINNVFVLTQFCCIVAFLTSAPTHYSITLNIFVAIVLFSIVSILLRVITGFFIGDNVTVVEDREVLCGYYNGQRKSMEISDIDSIDNKKYYLVVESKSDKTIFWTSEPEKLENEIVINSI